MENNVILTKYIAVWGWQMISLLFLIGTFILFSLPRTNLTLVFSVAFFLIFGATQFVCSKRRRELENEQKG